MTRSIFVRCYIMHIKHVNGLWLLSPHSCITRENETLLCFKTFKTPSLLMDMLVSVLLKQRNSGTRVQTVSLGAHHFCLTTILRSILWKWPRLRQLWLKTLHGASALLYVAAPAGEQVSLKWHLDLLIHAVSFWTYQPHNSHPFLPLHTEVRWIHSALELDDSVEVVWRVGGDMVFR